MEDKIKKIEKELEELKEAIKEFLAFWRVAQGFDWQIFFSVVGAEKFGEVIKKLKKLVNWTEKDEERVIKAATKLAEKPVKTTQDKRELVKSILKIGIPAILGMATGASIVALKNKKGDNGKKKAGN